MIDIFKLFNKNKNKRKIENDVIISDKELISKNIKDILGSSGDIKFRKILINNNENIKVTLIYIDGLVNSSYISDYILKPLIQENVIQQAKDIKEVLNLIKDGVLYYAGQEVCSDINKTINGIMSGSSVLVFDECKTSVIFDVKKFDKRSMSEPTVENVTKGAKDSFIENYRSNTATIRRKIKTQNLVIEETVIGKQTLTPVGIVYIKGITNDDLIKAVREKLNNINVDNILATGFIEEALSNDINSPFPQVRNTERPDIFCADIIEGRVGVIADGIPLGFIVPVKFIQLLQTAEDYSRNYLVASALRIIRYISFAISLLLPSLYIAITTFHPEMLPTKLVLFIAKSREGVTFPIAIEILGMLLVFEILYEAGLRIPKTVGQAVSIVGTLVVGQAAVEAKLLSPSAVVVIALTSIATFAMPNQDLSNAIRIWRFIFAIFASILGLYGVVISIILLTFDLCKLETFGTSYMSPLVSSTIEEAIYDTVIRSPLKYNKKRPHNLKTKDNIRQGE